MDGSKKPVFGFVLLGGLLSGALVRDVRLANELARRDYEVHAWWVMDRFDSAGLSPKIKQHWLFHGMRFWSRFGRGLWESIGRFLSRVFPESSRGHWIQRRPSRLEHMMKNVTNCVCDGVERESSIVQRFAHELNESGVTHVLPMLEFLCPWVAAARNHGARGVRYCVTFQGYELYSTYARAMEREADLFSRLQETVSQSDWQAIAVSPDYRDRVIEEVGIEPDSVVAIPPGVPPAERMEMNRAHELVKERFADYDKNVPLISYIGRRDVEKGIDILLYAARILRARGYEFQLAICGPSLWGDQYGKLCRQIAEELRLPVMWRRFVPEEVRTALFTASYCVVYPSIHREPFGMVAAEAAAHGTPAIVPDYGGVATAIEADGKEAGMRFKVWDSGDLANTLAKLLGDSKLRDKLSKAGPSVAEYYSIENLADRILAHLEVA